MNFCGKSFHIINKTVFQLRNVDLLSMIAFQHCVPYITFNWHIGLVYCCRMYCGDISFTVCVFMGHADNKIDEVWQQISWRGRRNMTKFCT